MPLTDRTRRSNVLSDQWRSHSHHRTTVDGATPVHASKRPYGRFATAWTGLYPLAVDEDNPAQNGMIINAGTATAHRKVWTKALHLRLTQSVEVAYDIRSNEGDLNSAAVEPSSQLMGPEASVEAPARIPIRRMKKWLNQGLERFTLSQSVHLKFHFGEDNSYRRADSCAMYL